MKLKQLSISLTLSFMSVSSLANILQLTPANPSCSADNSWFVSAGLGINFLSIDKKHNYLPDPPVSDDYIQKNVNDQTVASLTGGYRWATFQSWLPYYSVGINYSYASEAKAKGTINLYSLPDFNNYDYSYEVSTQTLMLVGKADIYNWHNFMPYVLAGGGVAFNRISNYKEQALPGVTLPRVSPAFGGSTETDSAYTVGVGVDYAPYTNLWFSLGYSYNDYGQIKTGKAGANNSNAGSSLKNNLATDNMMLSATYFFSA